MIDWEAIRTNHPLAATGKYFNTASFGSMSKSTIEGQKEHLDDILHNGNQNYGAWEEEYFNLKKELAVYLNCKNENIGIFPDVSLGLNKVAELFDTSREVILIEHDFPSVTLPWITKGYQIRWISYESFVPYVVII